MAKRLDFETALLKDLQRKREKRPIVKLPWVLGVFAVSAVLAASASAILTLFSSNGYKAVVETTSEFVSRLAENQLQAAAEFCPEGALGSQLTAAERARVFSPEALTLPPSGSDALETRVSQLNRIRKDLERAGLDWENARTIAFGGVCAEIFEPASMLEASGALVGNIYITDERKVYVIEVSLMDCLGSYVITDIWQWGALDIAPDTLKNHSRAQFDQFKNEHAEDNIEIKTPEHVFLKP
ncbi:MAG: hypothetical protein R6V12_03885 [Candidatus Hydrogenedentota bacterium]